MVEENPDDAAIDNNGIGATLPLLCICHAQLVNLAEDKEGTLFSIFLSCYKQKKSLNRIKFQVYDMKLR